MRWLPRALLSGGLGVAVALLVACGGGSGLLSADQSNSLSTMLHQVSSAVASGQCGQVATAGSGLYNAVSNLPSTVNQTLRQNLYQGVSTVTVLAQQDCQSSTTTSSSSTTRSSTSSTTSHPTSTTTHTTTSTATAPITVTTATSNTSSGTSSQGPRPSGGGGVSGGGQGQGQGQGNQQ